MSIGSLFSGIGGLELGLEWAGFGPTVFQVEIDAWCRKVLKKHWSEAKQFEDVCIVQGTTLPSVDLLCGGFPCQDVSVAGRGEGIGGSRSGLWSEFRRIISEANPRFVVVENVAGGKKRWLPTVRQDLHLLGYRTRAIQVSAFDVGAPHRRARVFVLASHADSEPFHEHQGGGARKSRERALQSGSARAPRIAPDSDCVGELQSGGGVEKFWRWTRNCDGWQIEPPICGVDDGIPKRMDRGRRLKALGNAVVPQCAEIAGLILKEWIGGANGTRAICVR